MSLKNLNERIDGKFMLVESDASKLPTGVLCRVSYPICNIGMLNANKRVYERAVWDKVLENTELQEKMVSRTLFGHAEHPKDDVQSNLEKVSHTITKMWITEDGKKVMQEYDILDTPYGRIVNTLLLAGCQAGVSTRAEGELEEAEDEVLGKHFKVIPESYKYITTDFTADPSTVGVYPARVERDIVGIVKNGLESNKIDSKYAICILESLKCNDAKVVLENIKKEKEENKVIKEMKLLGDRNYLLIKQAAGSLGTLNPEELLPMIQEELYIDEIDEIEAFLQWCYNNKKSFGSENYEQVFSDFKKTNPQYEHKALEDNRSGKYKLRSAKETGADDLKDVNKKTKKKETLKERVDHYDKYMTIDFEMEEPDIESPGETLLTPYKAEVYVTYHIDTRYGEGPEGEPGETRTFIDDIQIEGVENASGERIEPTEDMKVVIDDKARSLLGESKKPSESLGVIKESKKGKPNPKEDKNYSSLSDEEKLYFEKMASSLSKKTGIKLSGRDYWDWLDGGENFEKFEKAVLKFLGKKRFGQYELLGRLDNYLQYKLGLGPKSAGGINFESSKRVGTKELIKGHILSEQLRALAALTVDDLLDESKRSLASKRLIAQLQVPLDEAEKFIADQIGKDEETIYSNLIRFTKDKGLKILNEQLSRKDIIGLSNEDLEELYNTYDKIVGDDKAFGGRDVIYLMWLEDEMGKRGLLGESKKRFAEENKSFSATRKLITSLKINEAIASESLVKLEELYNETLRNYANDMVTLNEKNDILNKEGDEFEAEMTVKLKEYQDLLDQSKTQLDEIEASSKEEIKKLSESLVAKDNDIILLKTNLDKAEEQHKKELIKKFIECKLEFSGLNLSERVRALLEQSSSEEEAGELIERFRDALRESSLHFDSLSEVKVGTDRDAPSKEEERILNLIYHLMGRRK